MYDVEPLEMLAIPNTVTWIEFQTFLGCNSLKTVYIDNNINLENGVFEYDENAATKFPNQTTDQIVQWFDNEVFGAGSWTGVIEVTITCQNGIVYATSIFEDEEPMGWNLTVENF